MWDFLRRVLNLVNQRPISFIRQQADCTGKVPLGRVRGLAWAWGWAQSAAGGVTWRPRLWAPTLRGPAALQCRHSWVAGVTGFLAALVHLQNLMHLRHRNIR